MKIKSIIFITFFFMLATACQHDPLGIENNVLKHLLTDTVKIPPPVFNTKFKADSIIFNFKDRYGLNAKRDTFPFNWYPNNTYSTANLDTADGIYKLQINMNSFRLADGDSATEMIRNKVTSIALIADSILTNTQHTFHANDESFFSELTILNLAEGKDSKNEGNYNFNISIQKQKIIEGHIVITGIFLINVPVPQPQKTFYEFKSEFIIKFKLE